MYRWFDKSGRSLPECSKLMQTLHFKAIIKLSMWLKFNISHVALTFLVQFAVVFLVRGGGAHAPLGRVQPHSLGRGEDRARQRVLQARLLPHLRLQPFLHQHQPIPAEKKKAQKVNSTLYINQSRFLMKALIFLSASWRQSTVLCWTALATRATFPKC